MMYRFKKVALIVVLLIICYLSQVIAQDYGASVSFDREEELGQVHWYRDYDEAVPIAQKEGKHVVVLFQEVPSCLTCRTHGYDVLSHPLIVEAIESSFVPLAIFNNKEGRDIQVLNRYKEPSWNNPVVRIIDSSEKDVVDRIGNDYSALTNQTTQGGYSGTKETCFRIYEPFRGRVCCVISK